MLNFIKKYLSLLKQDFWLLAILSMPGLLFFFIGLNQLEAANWFTVIIGGLNKFAVEFLTISILFCILHILGIKKRWVFAVIMVLYYLTIAADIVLLTYFKERFDLKYLSTLHGGQYQFMFDFRIIFGAIFVYLFAYITIRRNWHKPSLHTSAKKLAVSAVLLLLIAIISPFTYLNTNKAFLAATLMDTTVVDITKDLLAKKPRYKEYTGYKELPANLATAAAKYNLFKPSEFKNTKTYDKIILLTTEAFSNKFMNAFNPEIPLEASNVFDGLASAYPFASIKNNTISTLYGLSVIFSGHPNAELMFKHGFPLSFVKILRDNGYKTAFFRGANEEYMGEHILFKQAGFESVYGAKYFAEQPGYSNYVSWWGLTDRKLFDYTLNYLKENKDKKLFIHLLTVDTHVPFGRVDYLGQDYPEINDKYLPNKIKKLYKKPNMLRAFARHNYDLGNFLKSLEDSGLLDAKTLVIITGDHPFYANVDTGAVFNNYKPVFDELPFMLVSGADIKQDWQAVSADIFKSQQDIAPTILELAGLNTPQGMFGRSIFEATDRTVFYMKSNYVKITNTHGTKLIPYSTKRPQDAAVVQLLNTVLK
ncbi:MAG: LTA synthase family protein [Elusimicrobiota bacterium]|jgi:hypothetical protein|nr:LTA synthase family protein [Elusimicrobiota bacterium]